MTGSDERRPAAVLVNHGAATADSGRVRRAVALVREALDADLHETSTRDVAELTRWMTARVDPYRTVVVAGGDGSLATAYNVLAGRPEVAIGYIPGGFGNATAHLLRLPRRPEQIADVILRGRPRAIDLVEVQGRLALFAGAGWDALVAGRYAATGARRLPGWAAAVARSVPDLARRPRVRIEADGALVHDGPIELVIVSVTPWYGRGLLVNPGARPDQGRLTLRVYPGPLPRFALEAARWATRRVPGVPGTDAGEVIVRGADDAPLAVQADGDLLGRRGEWRFVVRPAAVRLIGDW